MPCKIGIYPREPRNKKKASKSSTPSTTFYYTKDIQYLLHEPLLRKFREHKALAKKISRYLGRGEVSDAARIEKNHRTRLSLDHIVKERYPTFVDALRDLDDVLSMLFLFANLPSTSAVPNKTIALCQRLCMEFQHYLIVSHSLRKSFLSIKGIYYQATIQGQDILWLVPYQFVQRVTDDVDFRIMGTFVQFYTTLLGFINFRLYTSIGLVYPPKFSMDSADKGAELRAFTLEGRPIATETNGSALLEEAGDETVAENGHSNTNGEAQSKSNEDLEAVVQRIAATETQEDTANEIEPVEEAGAPDGTIDVFDAPISADADILPQPSISADTASALFASCTFFLSRETPRAPLEFLLRAFGCQRIGWDIVCGEGAYTNDESDSSITHQIVDRPPLPLDITMTANSFTEADEKDTTHTQGASSRNRVPGRTYVQPQWVWDCVNAGQLLRPDVYAPGAELPPHLSPWVKPSRGQYDPTIPLEEQEGEGEAEIDEVMEENDDHGNGEREKDGQLNARPDSISNEKTDILSIADSDDEEDGGMTVALDNSSEEDERRSRDKDEAEVEEWIGFGEAVSNKEASVKADENVEVEDEGEQGEREEDEDIIHQRELEAEAAGLPIHPSSTKPHGHLKSQPTVIPSSQSERNRTIMAAKKRRAEKEEELERQKMMMSRKKRKMLEKMLYSNRKRDEEALNLRRKRRKIEREREREHERGRGNEGARER